VAAERGEKEIRIAPIGVTNKEIVNHEREEDGACAMAKQARSTGAFVKTISAQTTTKGFIGNFASLFEAIHAVVNADIKIAIRGDKGAEGISIHDDGRNERGVNTHVFWLRESVIEVEVRNIEAACATIGGRENSIDQDFEGSEITGASMGVPIVREAVTTNSEANAIRVSFLRAKIANNTEVGDTFVRGDISLRDKGENIASFDTKGLKAATEACTFFGTSNFPTGTLGALA